MPRGFEWMRWARVHWRGLATAAAGVAAIVAGTVMWQAHTALNETAARMAQANVIAFRSTPFRPVLPVGFESIATPASFRDAVPFNGLLYVSGPTGLYAFNELGTEIARYRPGMELPPAPVTALATGTASNSARPELWIGTAGEGLLAFDGTSFRQVRPIDARHRKVTALLTLSTGRIVFGTEASGVLVYDGRSITPFHSSLANGHITALAGNDSSLWAATADRGLLHWRAGEFEQFHTSSGLPAAQVLSLAVDGERTYAGTAMGIAEFISGKFQRVLGDGLVTQALAMREDTLYAGTLEEGIFEIPLEARRSRIAAQAVIRGPESVFRLFVQGNEMMAVAASGVYRETARQRSWNRVLPGREAALLADRNIAALSADSAGRLWIGYFDRGLDVMEGASRVTHVENDHVFCVNRIVEDPERKLSAVATANGLVLFDASAHERQVLTRNDGLIANHVTDVLVQKGGFAIATPAGITLMDSGGMRSLYAFHGLVNNHAYTLAAHGDRLLVGTLGGLSILDGGIVKVNYTTGNSRLKHNWITALIPEGDGWFVGTYGAGVLRLDAHGAWSGFPDLKTESIVNPNAMLDTRSAILAGTLGEGLLVWNKSSQRWSRVIDGLPSLNVTALAARGNIVYIGTDNGLVQVPEENLIHR